ncbi:MAG: hypothetical protein GWP08_01580 [Nitrospiraceae bacterium]|nr:hypothetical protein [Nitrospiraceae bacterium]
MPVPRSTGYLVCLFGGYIASTSHSIMPETPLDNIIALYEALIDLS